MSGDVAASKNGVMPRELMTAPSNEPSPRVDDFALVIGVEHYPSLPRLNGAVGDAERFHQWVCSPEGGNVPAAHAHLILSTETPVAPVQHEIDNKLEALVRAADAVGGGRRLYFYFSGHGATEVGSPHNVALLLAMWSEWRNRMALSSAEYSDELAGAGLFEEIAVFLDCCRSTARGAAGERPTVTPPAEPPDRKSGRCSTKTWIAFASEAGRPAFERPVAGKWEGVFTRCLLAALTSSPGGIAADALKGRLESEVPDARPGQCAVVNNGLGATSWFGQRALVGSGLGAGSLPGQYGTPPELRITFRRARGTVKLQDGAFKEIDRHPVTPEPWVRPLAPGLYLLSDGSLEQPVKHLPGEPSHVEF